MLPIGDAEATSAVAATLNRPNFQAEGRRRSSNMQYQDDKNAPQSRVVRGQRPNSRQEARSDSGSPDYFSMQNKGRSKVNQSDNRRKDFPRNNGQQTLSIKFSQSVGTL